MSFIQFLLRSFKSGRGHCARFSHFCGAADRHRQERSIQLTFDPWLDFILSRAQPFLHPMVRRFQIGFGVFLLLCAVNYSALSRSNERGLSQEANMVYKAMKKGDVDTIIKLLADEPTTVTRRTTFWNGIDPRGAAGALKDSEVFPIDDLTRVVWVDRTVYLDKNDRDDLPKLKNALNLFLKVVSNTYGDLRIATSQWDHWETSRLGPSMEGKIASNAYWYVHFRPIGSNWRIWKIEVVLH